MAKKIPMRQCVGCNEMKVKKDMIRVLKTAEDPVCEETAGGTNICIDKTGKKNGRGAYLCNSMDCLKKAVKNKGLERSLKMKIPAGVYEMLESEFGESEQKT